MEFLDNKIINFTMKLFFLSIAMDLVSRIYFNDIGKSPQSKSAEGAFENNVESNPIHQTGQDKERSEFLDQDQKNFNDDNFNPTGISYLGSPNQIVHLDVYICTSCGFKKNFDELKEYLDSRLSNLRITEHEYPVKKMKKYLAYLVKILQFGGIIFTFLGDKILAYFGIPMPLILHQLM